MSGHHPTHTRMPMGNPPPVEHSIGGWNRLSHEAPGTGRLPAALNPQPLNLLRGMGAYVGSAIPLQSSHPAWLKVPGSHNGDGSGLLSSAVAGAPPQVVATDQLFRQTLANHESALTASAKYRPAPPYQGDMIDLSRPPASVERTEPIPLLTGAERGSHASRNGSAASESATPLNGEVNSSGKCVPAVVSVIAANPSHEKSVGKVENPVIPQEGSVDVNNKTDSEKGRAPTQHVKAAPVQTIVGHSKKIKSVEAIVENLFELGSKKQEADSTNASGVAEWTSQNNGKPNTAQTVPKIDSNVSDHGEGEDSESKMRRKRKIDTPTRKSMSPPPVKKTFMLEHEQGTKTTVSVSPEISSQMSISKPPPKPSSIQTASDGTPCAESSSPIPSSETNPIPVTSSSTSVLASLEDDSHPTPKSEFPPPVPTPTESTPSVVAPVKEESVPPSETSQSSVVPSSSECPLSSLSEGTGTGTGTPKEDTKNAVVDVESKMEALFAGIIGSGDEGAAGPSAHFGADLSNPLTPLNESLDLDTSSNIAAVLEAKPPSAKKGRPKGSRNGIRQSSDSIFGTSSTESTPQKGKKGKKKLSQDTIFGESHSNKSKKSLVAGKKAKFLKEPSQQTCDSGSTVSSVRIRGPVVHCVGPRDCPTQVSIVNAPPRDDEDQEKSCKAVKSKKATTGRRKLIQNEGKVTSTGLCSSTLVTRGELDQPQIPTVWVCVFCKMGPHVNSAGDLFGPYLIGGSDADPDHDTNDKKKGKQGTVNSPPGSQLGVLPVTPSIGEKTHYIVWTHEDCVVWASGVYLVGPRLAGLDEAVWAALNTKCDRCRHYGANLGCLQHGCPQRAHYKCAQNSGWHLNEDLFKCTCSVHPLKIESD